MALQPRALARNARHVAPSGAVNCLVPGTLVLTLDGAIPVDFLNDGDRIITRDSGTAVLRATRRARRCMAAVRIRAGSLGNTRPDRDVVLPARQEVLIRDWRAQALFGASQALVQASRLVDGAFVRDLGMVEVDTVALIFDAPHILYADGLELASAAPEMADR